MGVMGAKCAICGHPMTQQKPKRGAAVVSGSAVMDRAERPLFVKISRTYSSFVASSCHHPVTSQNRFSKSSVLSSTVVSCSPPYCLIALSRSATSLILTPPSQSPRLIQSLSNVHNLLRLKMASFQVCHTNRFQSYWPIIIQLVVRLTIKRIRSKAVELSVLSLSVQFIDRLHPFAVYMPN